MKYTKNLRIEGDKVYSYNTHVATIEGKKLLVHGHWSVTTSKHINHVASEYRLEKVDEEKPVKEKKDDMGLKTIATIASLGNMFGKNQKEKNDWKERMLKAGLESKGLIMPEDWNDLSEKVKEIRLNGVINIINK